jgi:phosphatidylserine decarboxylase
MIAKGSLVWILIPLILAAISIFLFMPLAVLYILITFFFIIFFRDPDRTKKDGIVAPADGKITEIMETDGCIKVVTVMNLHNVHVNRAPIDGKVKDMEHHNGNHVPAFNKESETNERLITTLDTKIGDVKIIQIAGAFARRIEPYIHKEDNIVSGQRIGIIRFGSRVDLLLPKNKVRIVVQKGDNVLAAESQLAVEIEDDKANLSA